MFKIYINFSENLYAGKFDRQKKGSCRKLGYRKICFGKFGVGKSVSENSVSENLLSEKSSDTRDIKIFRLKFEA